MTKTHSMGRNTFAKEGFDILKGEGGCIVCPTKAGYIIMTSDKAGLERKFTKERNCNKPGSRPAVLWDELQSPCAIES